MWNKYLLRIKSIHKNPSSYLFSLKSPCGFPIRRGRLYPFGSPGRRIGGMAGQKGAETAAFLSKHATSKIGCFPAFACGASYAWRLNSARTGVGQRRQGVRKMPRMQKTGNSAIFSEACLERNAAVSAPFCPAIPPMRLPGEPNGYRRPQRIGKPQGDFRENRYDKGFFNRCAAALRWFQSLSDTNRSSSCDNVPCFRNRPHCDPHR